MQQPSCQNFWGQFLGPIFWANLPTKLPRAGARGVLFDAARDSELTGWHARLRHGAANSVTTFQSRHGHASRHS
eukprot:COSAG06_NODE_44322_length_364_cov_1.083019_1_plen_73_part_01